MKHLLFVFFSLIYVLNAYIFNNIIKTSKYICYNRLYAGFGKKVESKNNNNIAKNDFMGMDLPNHRAQIKKVSLNSKCPCCSDKSYGDCCGRYINSNILPSNIVDTVRARYTSYAIGNAGFLIDSTHPDQKDYIRHSESSPNPKKARRTWEKEIITQNSEVFEFLKLEVLESDHNANTCSFNVLVRHRTEGSIIPFKETSQFAHITTNTNIDLPLNENQNQQNKKKKKKKRNKPIGEEEEEDLGFYLYMKGDVEVMDEETTKRLVDEAPKYMTQSIRDQW